MTRYWKAIMRHWNVEVIKDFERQEQIGARIQHKLSFLNQLIYKLAGVKKERNKQSLIKIFSKPSIFEKQILKNMILKSMTIISYASY